MVKDKIYVFMYRGEPRVGKYVSSKNTGIFGFRNHLFITHNGYRSFSDVHMDHIEEVSFWCRVFMWLDGIRFKEPK